MQQAVPAGQAAWRRDPWPGRRRCIGACAEAAQGEVVSAVNFNAPGQVVIAGAAAAVERAIEACKGYTRRQRAVALASHVLATGTDASGRRSVRRLGRKPAVAGAEDCAGAERRGAAVPA